MKRLVVAVLLVAMGCSSGTSNYLTGPDPGPVFKWTGATPEEAAWGEALWVEVRDCMARHDLTVSDARVRGMEVQVLDGAFHCGQVWAAGCTWTGSPPNIRVARPWLEYALPHEYVNLIWWRTGHRFMATPENPYGDDWSKHPFAECDPNSK